MITRLQKIGDEYFLKIDPAMLKESQIDENTPLIMQWDAEGLFVTAVDDVSDEDFQAALDKVNRKYANALQKLAE